MCPCDSPGSGDTRCLLQKEEGAQLQAPVKAKVKVKVVRRHCASDACRSADKRAPDLRSAAVVVCWSWHVGMKWLQQRMGSCIKTQHRLYCLPRKRYNSPLLSHWTQVNMEGKKKYTERPRRTVKAKCRIAFANVSMAYLGTFHTPMHRRLEVNKTVSL